MHLYELSEAYQRLAGMENAEEFEQALHDIAEDFNVKAENIAKLVMTLEAESKLYREQAQKFLDAARARANKAERLRDYLKHNMETIGVDRVKGKLLSVRLRQSSPKVEVTDFTAIPDKYVDVEYKIKKRQILDDLKETGQIPSGVEITTDKSLHIGP